MSELRKHFWVLVLFSFVVFQPIFAENTGSVSGKVTSEKSRRGIPDVEIILSNFVSKEEKKTKTDNNGVYAFDNLEPGKYRILNTFRYHNYYYDWNNSIVNIVSGKKTVFNIELKLGGSISGKIYNTDGHTPIAGVLVESIDEKGRLEGYTNTKDDGSFLIRGIRPSSKCSIEVISIKVLDNIVVKKGRETKVKDIIFDLKGATGIEGYITSKCDGGPIEKAGIEIRKITPTGDNIINNREIFTDKSGRFKIMRLEPGEYSYRVRPPYPYKDKSTGNPIYPLGFMHNFFVSGKITIKKSGMLSLLLVRLNIPSDSEAYKTNVEVRFKYEARLDKKPNYFRFQGLGPGTPLFIGEKIVENQLTYKFHGIPPGEYELSIDFQDNGKTFSNLRSYFWGEQHEIVIPWDYSVIIDVVISEKKVNKRVSWYSAVNHSNSDLLEIIRNRKEKTVYYKMEVVNECYQK